jgi:O-glycosyl hydrolase
MGQAGSEVRSRNQNEHLPANKKRGGMPVSSKSLMLAALLLGIHAVRSSAQQTVTIDSLSPRQTWEGWGTSLAWFANGAGTWSEPNRTALAQALFDPQKGLGLTLVRYNIGAGDNPQNPKPIRPARQGVPGFEPAPGKFDWHADAAQRRFLNEARSFGADELEAISFSPPYWMTISGTSQGSVDGGSNIQKRYFGTQPGSFADYLTAVVAHYSKHWGVRFRDLDPLNEPLPHWWKAGDQKQDGCHFSQVEQDELIRDVGASLAARHLLTTVAAPDEDSIDNAIVELNHYNPQAMEQIHQINVHSYAGTKRSELRSFAQSAGKRLTLSEWGSSDHTGKDLAQHIQADVAQMGVVSWSIWQPDWPRVIAIDYKTQQFSLTPMYSVLANYTRFIRPGAQIFPTADPDTLAAYDARNHQLIVVRQNWSDHGVSVVYNFAGFSLENSSVNAYRTTAEESLHETGAQPIATSEFTALSPAKSVTTFIVNGVLIGAPFKPIDANQENLASAARGNAQIRFQGAWKARHEQQGKGHPEYRACRAGASYEVRFGGTQARVFGSFGPDKGIVAFSVDGGAETDVDLYSTKRMEDAQIFATQLLPEGDHALRARATDRRVWASSGTCISFTRAESLPPSTPVP